MGRSAALLAFPLMLLAGCASTADPAKSPQGPPAAEGHGLLPPPAATSERLAGVPPKHEFALDPSGAFSRTLFTADGPRLTVTARDIHVPPHRETQPMRLPGAVLVQVNAGGGTATLDATRTELSAARLFTVSAGTRIAFRNTGDGELSIRLYVMEARP